MNQIILLYLVFTITNFCLVLAQNNTTLSYNTTTTTATTKMKSEHRRCRHHLKTHCWHLTKILKQSEATVIIKKCTTRAVTHHCPTPTLTMNNGQFEGNLRHTQNMKTFNAPSAKKTDYEPYDWSPSSTNNRKHDIPSFATFSALTKTVSSKNFVFATASPIIPAVTIILDSTFTKTLPDATYAAASLPKVTEAHDHNKNSINTADNNGINAANNNGANPASNKDTDNTSNSNQSQKDTHASNPNNNSDTQSDNVGKDSDDNINNRDGDTSNADRDENTGDETDSDGSEDEYGQEDSNDTESREQDDEYSSDSYDDSDGNDDDESDDDPSYSSTIIPSPTIQQATPSQTSDPSIFGGNELSVSNSVSNKALGIGLGVGIGCVAALGLAGLLFHNKRKRLQDSMVENPDIGTRWSPQNFRDVVASTVSNLPRSPSQRSRTSIGH